MIRSNIRFQRWLTSSNCKAADLSNIALFVTVAFSSSMSTWWGWIFTDRFYTPAYCHIILVASSSSWKFIVTIFTTFTAHHSFTTHSMLKTCEYSSEWVGFNVPSTHYRSFRRWVFPVNHLHWYWQNLTRTTKRQNTQITKNNTMQKVALVISTTDTLKNLG